MTRWQYAWLRDEPQLSVFFSHAQGPALIPEFSAILGPMLFVQNSTEWVLSLDKNRVNLPYMAGLLGDRGWELVAVDSKLMPGAMAPTQLQTTWYFNETRRRIVILERLGRALLWVAAGSLLVFGVSSFLAPSWAVASFRGRSGRSWRRRSGRGRSAPGSSLFTRLGFATRRACIRCWCTCGCSGSGS